MQQMGTPSSASLHWRSARELGQLHAFTKKASFIERELIIAREKHGGTDKS